VSPEDRLIADAWLVASIDLEIDVTAPYIVEGFDGAPIEYVALLHGFGTAVGTLICTTNDNFDFAFEISEARGFYATALNPIHYSNYDRAGFIEALDDWGWYGTRPAPSWYRRGSD
jgi:hypothetical protein